MQREKLFRWAIICLWAVVLSFIIYTLSQWRPIVSKIREKKIVYMRNPNELGWKAHTRDVVNSLEIRGEINYSENDYVIVLLGDSQVEANSMPFDRMPASILEKQINNKKVKVVSLGVSGYGTDQELMLLREYFNAGYRADLVLLWFTPENDVWNSIFPSHNPGGNQPKPTFTIKDGQLSGPQYYDYRNFVDRLPKGYEFKGNKQNAKELKNVSWHSDRIEGCHGGAILYQFPICDRVKYGCKLVNLLLNEIGKAAKKNNAKFLVFYNKFNDKRQFFVKPDNIEGDYYIKSSKSFVAFSNKAYHDNLAKILTNTNNIGFLIEEKAPFINRNTNRHFNESANKEVMGKLVKYLEENNYLK